MTIKPSVAVIAMNPVRFFQLNVTYQGTLLAISKLLSRRDTHLSNIDQVYVSDLAHFEIKEHWHVLAIKGPKLWFVSLPTHFDS